MQEMLRKNQHLENGNLLKGLYSITKWNLSQECKIGLPYKNQSMCYTIATQQRNKTT
jgi:hypothetical protein